MGTDSRLQTTRSGTPALAAVGSRQRTWCVALAALALALGLTGSPHACTPAPPTGAADLPSARPPILEGGSERPKRLLLGLAPVFYGDGAAGEYEALAAYLAARLGLPIEIKLGPSYAAVATALSRFEVHIAVLPPYAYVQAKRAMPSLVLLATEIADGSSTYAGYIIVRDDSGIDTLEALHGRRFGFVDPDSTTGYLYPYALLRQMSIEPDAFFAQTVFAGSHSRLIDMVLDGQVDAGATFSAAYKRAASEHPQGRHLRILAKTGRVPLDAFCASPRLAQSLIDALRTALLELSTRTDEGRKILRGFTAVNGFVASGDEMFDDVRRTARLVEEGEP